METQGHTQDCSYYAIKLRRFHFIEHITALISFNDSRKNPLVLVSPQGKIDILWEDMVVSLTENCEIDVSALLVRGGDRVFYYHFPCERGDFTDAFAFVEKLFRRKILDNKDDLFHNKIRTNDPTRINDYSNYKPLSLLEYITSNEQQEYEFLSSLMSSIK
jgi:hypothetical protein